MKINEQITVDWHHNVVKKTTSCVLSVNYQAGNLFVPKEFIAVAQCGHGDQFNKKVGRKLALTRVLKKSGLPKPVRTEIWAVIWSRGVKI